MTRYSVAMTEDINLDLRRHLLRADRQEDVVIATWAPSTGASRTTAVVRRVLLPQEGERLVHGNASFTSGYVIRAAREAHQQGEGIVLLHSHPRGVDWQGLSRPDQDTEADYRRAATAITSMPLVGMTLAGDGAWSARFWHNNEPQWAESVRVVAPALEMTFNPDLRPVPVTTAAQVRTVSAWGDQTQATMARLRVLVVGTGSVGLDVAQRLAATGLTDVGVMDYDAVEELNLDRMVGATRLDAALGRAKVDVAARLATTAATAQRFTVHRHELSVTDPEGFAAALDYDVIVSCVDRPWPRAVLNTLAYADLIPVIDGGIGLDSFQDGRLRSGIWRSHTLVPGRPCLICMGQVQMKELSLDRRGLLDDPKYIAAAGLAAPAKQNVAALSASVSAAVLAQLVSLIAHPGGRGVPGPLRYMLATHNLEHVPAETQKYCQVEPQVALADHRFDLTEYQTNWRNTVAVRRRKKTPLRLRLLAAGEQLWHRQIRRLGR